jgi:DNA end-binding protein Ku
MATAARAVWKGFLKLGAVTCAVKLIGATSESSKIHFKILNRRNHTPVKSAYLDEVTDELVEADEQMKGYQLDGGDFVEIDPEEIKKLKLTSNHTLEIDQTVDVDAIDQRYLEKPYYLVPADAVAAKPFAVIRDALEKKRAAARSCIVLYQRGREVVIEPYGKGMLMTTLRDANEVIGETQVFKGIAEAKIDAEMVEIANLLIDKKQGKFDPSDFEDRYENALAEMIEAKKAGKKPPKPVAPPKRTNVVNLAEVLKKSLAKEGIEAKQKRKA